MPTLAIPIKLLLRAVAREKEPRAKRKSILQRLNVTGWLVKNPCERWPHMAIELSQKSVTIGSSQICYDYMAQVMTTRTLTSQRIQLSII
jgi:hypothetical protein